MSEALTSIGTHAFNSCTGITSIIIPQKVTSIGRNAFYGCTDLSTVIVEPTTPIEITENVFSNRANATLYVPRNSKSAYEVAEYWKDFDTIKEYPNGDVNQDGETDVLDVVDIARYVIDTPSESFDVFLADLNSDKTVNVADAVVLVNEIAGDTSWAPRMDEGNNVSNDLLTLTENDNHSLSLQLEGDGRYTAFQLDLLLPADLDVMQMQLNNQRKHGHQLLYNKVNEGHFRVIALSTSNNEFNGTSGELLNIVLEGFDSDEIVVENIHFVTPQGADVPFEAISLSHDGSTTGIGNVDSSQQVTERDEIYNLKGERLSTPQKGLNIINGKKVIIK